MLHARKHRIGLLVSGVATTMVAVVSCSTSLGNSSAAPPSQSTLDGSISESSAGPSPDGSTDFSACPALGTPLFDTIPIALSDFLAFRPLGFMSTPIHMFPAKHSAFSMTPPGQTPIRKPVVSPGKLWVKEIWEATFSTGGANYQLYLHPCPEVRVYFGHIASLSARLVTEMQKTTPSCNSFKDGTATVTTCRHLNMSVFLDSGEEIGMGPDSAGVDFGVKDERLQPAPFIRIDHYDHFYPYWASPLDYFRADVKSTLEGRTGHIFGTQMRTAPPIGGTHMQDMSGAAQGNWFFPGSYHANSTDLSPSLGLASDYVDPAQPLMAIGTKVAGVSMGLYSFPVSNQGQTNRAFRDVKVDGKTYCYDSFLTGKSTGGMPLGTMSGVLLMTMPTDTTLKVERVSGSSCATANQVFGASAVQFER